MKNDVPRMEGHVVAVGFQQHLPGRSLRRHAGAPALDDICVEACVERADAVDQRRAPCEQVQRDRLHEPLGDSLGKLPDAAQRAFHHCQLRRVVRRPAQPGELGGLRLQAHEEVPNGRKSEEGTDVALFVVVLYGGFRCCGPKA